jgi:hypothetical protein
VHRFVSHFEQRSRLTHQQTARPNLSGSQAFAAALFAHARIHTSCPKLSESRPTVGVLRGGFMPQLWRKQFGRVHQVPAQRDYWMNISLPLYRLSYRQIITLDVTESFENPPRPGSL